MKSILDITKFNYKEILDPKNELILIGLISIFIFIWIILYAVPGLLSNLFNTILGKLILLSSIILISYKNIKYGIITFVILIIIYRLISYTHTNSKTKEGFTWEQSKIDDFLEIQKSINPDVVFDASEVQKQASQEEVDYFIKNGHWKWSKETDDLYIKSLYNNPYVRTNPQTALETMRTIYNENAILQLLSWQSKEGQFLRNGVSLRGGKINKYQALPNGWGDYAFDSGQITHTDNIIKCGTNKNDAKLSLQQILYMGNGGILYEHVKKIIPVDYNNLEKLIPGFKFLKKPCNPCEAMDEPANYTCPFQLDISGSDPGVSDIWKYLWFTPAKI
jgi:cytochrome c2